MKEKEKTHEKGGGVEAEDRLRTRRKGLKCIRKGKNRYENRIEEEENEEKRRGYG